MGAGTCLLDACILGRLGPLLAAAIRIITLLPRYKDKGVGFVSRVSGLLRSPVRDMYQGGALVIIVGD
jgi:hypothetical protein